VLLLSPFTWHFLGRVLRNALHLYIPRPAPFAQGVGGEPTSLASLTDKSWPRLRRLLEVGPSNTADVIGRQFLAALASQDWEGMRKLLADDAHWTMPGSGPSSFTARGATAMVERARSIVGSGVHTEVLHVLVGDHGVTLSLHNTAHRPDGRQLDEYLATVLAVKDGRISAIDTYLSDVPAMEAFFA